MSNIISVLVGGIRRYFTAKFIKTNLSGGGTCLWKNINEVPLTEKYITENGVYNAADDGCYGYSSVQVINTGHVSGKGQDGNQYDVYVDSGGNIQQKIVPSYIRVDVAPVKLNYIDGETIDYTGLVIKAYTNAGNLWTDDAHPNGIIKINELIFPKTSADIQQMIGRVATSSLIDGELQIDNGDLTIIHHSYVGIDEATVTCSGATVAAKREGNWIRRLYAWSSRVTADEYYESKWLDVYPEYQDRYHPGEIIETRTNTLDLYNTSTYDGKTVYFIAASAGYAGEIQNPPPESDIQFDGDAAWTMIYGTITGGYESIPVQFSRPGDGAILECSFEITVHVSEG